MARRSTPTFITRDASGRTTYDFQGHVHAQGLDIDAGSSSTPPTEDRVRWLRTSDGAMVAQIYAYENSSTDAAYMGVTNPDNPVTAPPQAAYLETVVSRISGVSEVLALAGTTPRTIIDSNGGSAFLQLNSPGARKIATGTVTFTFAGGTISNLATVFHGLPSTPSTVIVSNQFINGIADVIGYSANFTSTDFLAIGRSPGGPWTGSIIHNWLAIA